MSGIKLSGFARLDAPAQENALRELSRPNGAAARIQERIVAFEEQYGMSSAEMIRRLSDGLLDESWDICQWLFFLRHRDNRAGAPHAE